MYIINLVGLQELHGLQKNQILRRARANRARPRPPPGGRRGAGGTWFKSWYEPDQLRLDSTRGLQGRARSGAARARAGPAHLGRVGPGSPRRRLRAPRGRGGFRCNIFIIIIIIMIIIIVIIVSSSSNHHQLSIINYHQSSIINRRQLQTQCVSPRRGGRAGGTAR